MAKVAVHKHMGAEEEKARKADEAQVENNTTQKTTRTAAAKNKPRSKPKRLAPVTMSSH